MLLEYGNPLGYLPLREHLSLQLSERGIAASRQGRSRSC